MSYDEQLKLVIKHSIKSSFEKSKVKTEEMFRKLIPSDKMREGGFAINDKSDFMKGCAVASFYIASNMIDEALRIKGMDKLPHNLVEYKIQLQEEYSKKLCLYFDVDH